MARARTPEERTWLAAAAAAGLSAEDDGDVLIEKAATLGITAGGITAGWMVGIGTDIHGEEHETPVAYAVMNGDQSETGGESVEVALRLAIGQALVKHDTGDAGQAR